MLRRRLRRKASRQAAAPMNSRPGLVELLQSAAYAIHIATGAALVTDSAFYWRQPFDEYAFHVVRNAVSIPPDGEDLLELREYLWARHEEALRRIGHRATMHLLFRDDCDDPADQFEVVWAFATLADLRLFTAAM